MLRQVVAALLAAHCIGHGGTSATSPPPPGVAVELRLCPSCSPGGAGFGAIGQTLQLEPSFHEVTGAQIPLSVPVEFESSDARVVQVDRAGRITTVGYGEAIVSGRAVVGGRCLVGRYPVSVGRAVPGV